MVPELDGVTAIEHSFAAVKWLSRTWVPSSQGQADGAIAEVPVGRTDLVDRLTVGADGGGVWVTYIKVKLNAR